jgi:hypothetical protein
MEGAPKRINKYGLSFAPMELLRTRNRLKAGSQGEAGPLQAWSGPEGSRKIIFSDFMTTAQDGGKVVSLTHRPPLPLRNTPGNHFC